MSVNEVRHRLLAWEAGKPLLRYATLHHAVVAPKNALIVAFVRMAGESRPWGIAWGHPGSKPIIMSVPDGRVRDDVAAVCAEFGESLLEHMRVQNWTYKPLPKDAVPDTLRQVWVPNGQHVAIFHQLAYAYSQTKFGGERREILNALGSLSGWLFRDSSRRGCQHIIDASAALRAAYAFPVEDARQAHLGLLLAWLSTNGGLDERIAAAEVAEAIAVSPTMDPDFERDMLAPQVEKRVKLRADSGDFGREDAAIIDLLEPELLRRWDLCADAYATIAGCDIPVNPGVDALVTDALDEFYWQVQALEIKIANPEGGSPFVSHPETDFHGSAAASRYLSFAAADEKYMNVLIHDDCELLAEAVADGRALRCEVTAVRDDGEGRKKLPIWTVRHAGSVSTRLREGNRVTPIGASGRWATIISISTVDGVTSLELEWSEGKTIALPMGAQAAPLDPDWVGHEITLVAADAAGLTKWRSFRVWAAREGPGAWLTHSHSRTPIIADIASDTAEEIVDDVEQIEGAGG